MKTDYPRKLSEGKVLDNSSDYKILLIIFLGILLALKTDFTELYCGIFYLTIS